MQTAVAQFGSVSALKAWYKSARIGDRFCYYIGRGELEEGPVFDQARRYYEEDGAVFLTQDRLNSQTRYYAERCRPRTLEKIERAGDIASFPRRKRK